MNLKIGVTGAGGYIGSRVVKKCLERGHEIAAIDNFRNAQVKSVDGEKVKEIDIKNQENLKEAFSDVDVVIHLAAISGVDECQENNREAFESNVLGTLNVAWFCRENSVPLIAAGSMAVVGDPKPPIDSDSERSPLNFYGQTKKMNEDDIRELSKDRFPAYYFLKSNVFGTHQVNGKEIGKGTVINYFLKRAEERKPLTVYKPGSQARDFIHVKDVSRAYVKAAEKIVEKEFTGLETIPLASGSSTSVKEVAETIKQIFSKRGIDVETKLVENPRNNETLVDRFEVDISKAKKELGFRPEKDLEEWLEREAEAIL